MARNTTLFLMLYLSLKNNIVRTKISETDQLKSQIEKTDREIDALVYEIYGLTPEEIKVVEGEKKNIV